jgi:sulfate adenylyltransferase subunit 2
MASLYLEKKEDYNKIDMVDRLQKLESKSIYILREAYARYRHAALLWSTGKDSTIMLWLARKAFFGNIPFPVIHIDTGCLLEEIYEYRDRYAREWDLDLLIARNDAALEKGNNPAHFDNEECCKLLKRTTLTETRKKYGFHALFFGIRGDEHGYAGSDGALLLQSDEAVRHHSYELPAYWDFLASQKKVEDHIRIHPMVHWSVTDMWLYVKQEKIPVIDLYFARNGKRYNSIGCAPCCEPVDSRANSIDKIVKEITLKSHEVAGKEQSEDTYTIQKLKSLGYM